MDSLYEKGYLERKCWGKQRDGLSCLREEKVHVWEHEYTHMYTYKVWGEKYSRSTSWGPNEPLQPSPLTTHSEILCSPHRTDLLSSAPPISSPLFTSSSWPGVLYCESFCILVSFKIQLKFHDLSQALPDKPGPECLFLPLSSYIHCPSFIKIILLIIIPTAE